MSARLLRQGLELLLLLVIGELVEMVAHSTVILALVSLLLRIIVKHLSDLFFLDFILWLRVLLSLLIKQLSHLVLNHRMSRLGHGTVTSSIRIL